MNGCFPFVKKWNLSVGGDKLCIQSFHVMVYIQKCSRQHFICFLQNLVWSSDFFTSFSIWLVFLWCQILAGRISCFVCCSMLLTCFHVCISSLHPSFSVFKWIQISTPFSLHSITGPVSWLLCTGALTRISSQWFLEEPWSRPHLSVPVSQKLPQHWFLSSIKHIGLLQSDTQRIQKAWDFPLTSTNSSCCSTSWICNQQTVKKSLH